MLSYEEIVALHKKHAPSSDAFGLVFTHCEIVWQIAEQLIERSGLDIDAELVKTGCLLHDLGVYRMYLPNGEIDHANYILHGTRGDDLMKEEGLSETFRRFASHHTGVGLSRQDVIDQKLPLPVADYLAETPEERLVMYADKFHTKTTPPKFMTAKTYEEHIARFGGLKVRAFKKLQEEFGIPDLAPLAAKYRSELISPRGVLYWGHMKIYSWNVNGIRAVDKKGALKAFIEKENPDVICFQETKAHETQLDLEFPEYEKFWHSAEKKGYAGTAIWTKIPPVSVSYGLPEGLIEEYKLDSDAYGDPSNEGRVMTMEFENFFLVTVYTPNSKGDLSRLELRHKQWDPAFLQYIKRREETKPVIFCGDLNVAHTELDLANPKPNMGKHGFTLEEREGFDKFLEAGLADTFRMFNEEGGNYTWWSHWANARARNVGWRIDYFLASEGIQKQIKSAAIHPDVLGSDHCPVSLEVEA